MADKPLVVLDPGHGGRSPGAVSRSGLREKEINMAICLAVYQALEGLAEVLLTRQGDVNVTLAQRAALANAARADCFVSVHCNSSVDRRARGTETFCFPGSAAGRRLAGLLQQHLVRSLYLPDRGVKTARFAVLRQTRMPAALVEVAFLSNTVEEELLRDQAVRQKAGRALARGIGEFLGL